MSAKVFRLAHKQAREGAAHYILREAPDGWVVRISEPLKKREQEEKYHAMIKDIALQSDYAERRWVEDDMKRLLVDEFAYEMRLAGTPLRHDSRVVPSENGLRIIQLGVPTSKFRISEAAAFIDFLYAWGAERDVRWSEQAKEHA